jgi:hypothetical protein
MSCNARSSNVHMKGCALQSSCSVITSYNVVPDAAEPCAMYMRTHAARARMALAWCAHTFAVDCTQPNRIGMSQTVITIMMLVVFTIFIVFNSLVMHSIYYYILYTYMYVCG